MTDSTPTKEITPMITPTDEQQAAIDLFLTGGSLAIEAGAGTGKTSTLRLLSEAAPQTPIQYIAFNRDIVKESATKFPSNVACRTAHSLAWRAIVGPSASRKARLKNSGRMKSLEIADRLSIQPIEITVPGEDGAPGHPKAMSRSYLASLVMRTIKKFCQTADAEPDTTHVPYIKGIDIPPNAMTNNRIVRDHLLTYVKRAWADITSERGELPFKHDHYLKMWQISNPKIGAKAILFDEAQDANPVLRSIVEAQTHAQIVWVGDSQQQIYEFTGAVNALAEVTTENRTFLSQSFRFGPEVAEVANTVLAALDAELRITGSGQPGTIGEVADPDAILCRTNAAAVSALLAALADGKRAALAGGGKDVIYFAEAARDLINTGRTTHPELICFDSWDEVERYVAEDEQGEELRLLVKLVNDFGVDVILDALRRMPEEQDADLIISTAHKAKGREWDAVRLAGDFSDEPNASELRLLYVAVTRARKALDITQVGWFNLDIDPSDSEAADDIEDDGNAGVQVEAPEAPHEAQDASGDAPEDPIVAQARLVVEAWQTGAGLIPQVEKLEKLFADRRAS